MTKNFGKILQDTSYKLESFRCQDWRRNQRGKVQSQRSMKFLRGSSVLRDRECMTHLTQCPLRSMFQAHKDPIQKPWLCRQGNIAQPDKACNSRPRLCPAQNMSRQDISRRQTRWRSREDNIFRQDKGSKLRLCQCPGMRKTLEDTSPTLLMMNIR